MGALGTNLIGLGHFAEGFQYLCSSLLIRVYPLQRIFLNPP
jgi:hypothetical protein